MVSGLVGHAAATSGLASQPDHILIDGDPVAVVDVRDRGLHYGDGVFETLLCKQGELRLAERHEARLAAGAARLGLDPALPERLMGEAAALAEGRDAAVIKLLITRGSGGRGYRPDPGLPARRIALSYPLLADPDPRWESGVRIRYCQTTASLNPALAGIKHLNRLDSVLARAEWRDPDIAEGLMRDCSGALIGGTLSNLFVWHGDALSTPAVEDAGIAGTVRAEVMALAADWGLECTSRRLSPSELKTAAGLFLTNSLIGVWPVARLETQPFDLADLPWEFLAAVRARARG